MKIRFIELKILGFIFQSVTCFQKTIPSSMKDYVNLIVLRCVILDILFLQCIKPVSLAGELFHFVSNCSILPKNIRRYRQIWEDEGNRIFPNLLLNINTFTRCQHASSQVYWQSADHHIRLRCCRISIIQFLTQHNPTCFPKMIPSSNGGPTNLIMTRSFAKLQH